MQTIKNIDKHIITRELTINSFSVNDREFIINALMDI